MDAFERFCKVKQMSKTAAMSEGMKNALTLAGIGVATPIVTALGFDAVNAIKSKIQGFGNYKEMVKYDPSIKDLPQAKVKSVFSTLQKLNPDFAADPAIASSFVKMVSEVGITPQVAEQLISSRQRWQNLASPYRADLGGARAILEAYNAPEEAAQMQRLEDRRESASKNLEEARQQAAINLQKSQHNFQSAQAEDQRKFQRALHKAQAEKARNLAFINEQFKVMGRDAQNIWDIDPTLIRRKM